MKRGTVPTPGAGGEKEVGSLDDLLRRASIAPGSKAAGQLRGFLELLEKWNRGINLTASTDWTDLEPLFREAVWAAGLYPEAARTHLDIGSGGGFPALPLRILVPRMHLDMVESRTKKCVFLETAVRELGLESTRVIQDRLDSFLARSREPWDCVSWKGVRLATADLVALAERATERTRFWMFHGREAAVRDEKRLGETLVLERKEACPARKGWWLSIYRTRGAGN